MHLIERFNIVDNANNPIQDLEDKQFAVASINALLEYLNETQMTSLEHINTITIYNLSKYMSLDINARRNLEITEKMRDKSKKGTLLWDGENITLVENHFFLKKFHMNLELKNFY